MEDIHDDGLLRSRLFSLGMGIYTQLETCLNIPASFSIGCHSNEYKRHVYFLIVK